MLCGTVQLQGGSGFVKLTEIAVCDAGIRTQLGVQLIEAISPECSGATVARRQPRLGAHGVDCERWVVVSAEPLGNREAGGSEALRNFSASAQLCDGHVSEIPSAEQASENLLV